MEQKTDKELLTEWLNSIETGEIKADQILSNILDVMDQREHEVKQRREQILDINQWASIMLQNRSMLRPRILWSMIADISNRTTD